MFIDRNIWSQEEYFITEQETEEKISRMIIIVSDLTGALFVDVQIAIFYICTLRALKDLKRSQMWASLLGFAQFSISLTNQNQALAKITAHSDQNFTAAHLYVH